MKNPFEAENAWLMQANFFTVNSEYQKSARRSPIESVDVISLGEDHAHVLCAKYRSQYGER